MTKVYCSYESDGWCDREPDPDDELDNGDYGGTYFVTGVHLRHGMRDAHDTTEEFQVGDTVWVVWVSYSSGSTFGTTGGHGEIVAVTKNQGAAVQACYWAEGKGEWPESLTDPAYGKYKPWEGYFEHAQQYRIEQFTVQP